MSTSFSALLSSLVCCCGFWSWQARLAEAADIAVGGASGWANNVQYSPLQGQQGDTLVFNYQSGRHNVMEVASLSCSALASNSAKTIAATSDPTPVRVTLDAAGLRYFACSVGDHCDEGQLIQVTTNAGNAAPPIAAPSTSPAASTEAVPATAPSPANASAGSTPIGVLSAPPISTTSPPAQGSAVAGAAAAGTAASGSAAYYRNHAYLKHIHGWLLGTAFIFLMPLAILISRGWKSQRHSIWFHLHWALQSIAVILAVCGVVLGHYFKISDNLHKAHRIIGIIAVCFLGFQVVVAAALRPHPQKWLRRIWNLQHWWTGRAALILGIINFYIGVYMYYDGDSVNKGLHLYIAAAAILGTFIVIAILKDGYAYLRKPISQATSKGGVELVAGQVGETDYSVMDTGNLANNGTHTA